MPLVLLVLLGRARARAPSQHRFSSPPARVAMATAFVSGEPPFFQHFFVSVLCGKPNSWVAQSVREKLNMMGVHWTADR